MLKQPTTMRNRSNASSGASSQLKSLVDGDIHTLSKDAETLAAFSFQSDDEPLRVVPFFEIHSPLEKKRRLGRRAHSSRAESYSQTPSESHSLRLLQWSCLFPREICFEANQDCLPGDLILFDPTEPLIFGQLDGHQDPILVQAAHLFQVLLEQHCYNCASKDEDDFLVLDETLECMMALLRDCPCVAQVQYPLPSEFWMDKNECHCFPLVHFCVTGCLAGLAACYQAFPEAIGCAVHGWLPLHFAARFSPYGSVKFLLDYFPNAARRTHPRTHKAPLHVACQRSNPQAKSSIVRRIMQQFPTALQLADRQGWVPVHHLCAGKSTEVYLLQTLIEASPATIRATTCHLELPLHILCRQGSCQVDSIRYLLTSVHADPQQAQATDLDQNNILHCIASNSDATKEAIMLLLTASKGKGFPNTVLECPNMNGETPFEVLINSPHGEHQQQLARLLSTSCFTLAR